MYKRIWVSRDMDGDWDIWSKEPYYESGIFLDGESHPGDLAWNFGENIDDSKGTHWFHLINVQLGMPKRGEIWCVTLKNGTFYY